MDDLSIWEIGAGFSPVQSNKKRLALQATPEAVTSEVNGGAGTERIARNSDAFRVGRGKTQHNFGRKLGHAGFPIVE